MSNLLIKNGLVFDPINNISGEKKDILVENGKIIDSFKKIRINEVKTIDANGKTVIPGAIDIHTHVASQQVNNIRLLGSNNKQFFELWHGLTLDYITKEYVSKGYTFITEANVFPSLAKQTIFNFERIPILDKAMLINASNLWALELEYQKSDVKRASVFLSNLLDLVKGFGLKIYNPFESEEWDFKEQRKDISSPGRLFNFSALDVYNSVVKFNENLELPSSIHAHIEGSQGDNGLSNVLKVLQEIKNQGNGVNKRRSQIFHLVHASAYGFDGIKLIDFFNSNDFCDFDIGFMNFNPLTPLITSDRSEIEHFMGVEGDKGIFPIIKGAIESEGDHFESLIENSKDNEYTCMMWANALNLALGVKDKWKMQFSINFPNYANIKDIPEIIGWLISKAKREDILNSLTPEIKKYLKTDYFEENLSFKDLIIITRASPAKSLGISHLKGNLGVGADADINILSINLKDLDPQTDADDITRAFSDVNMVIKNGIVVKKGDQFNFDSKGSLYWSKGSIEESDYDKIMEKKRDYYRKFSSIFYESLKISTDKINLVEI